MRYFHINKNKYFNPIVNVDKVRRALSTVTGEDACLQPGRP